MLRFSAATIGYDNIAVVEDMDLCLNRGERVSIVGPSGSGKTTILKAIWNEAELISGTLEDTFASQSVIFQHAGLFDFLTARENISVTVPSASYLQVEAMAEKLGVLDILDSYVSKLSGGQAQRVQILRALLASSELLIIDEPTSSLDMVNKEMFINLLLDNLSIDTSVILVTHDLEEAVLLSDHIYIVSGGRIVKSLKNIEAKDRTRSNNQFTKVVGELREVILNENH